MFTGFSLLSSSSSLDVVWYCGSRLQCTIYTLHHVLLLLFFFAECYEHFLRQIHSTICSAIASTIWRCRCRIAVRQLSECECARLRFNFDHHYVEILPVFFFRFFSARLGFFTFASHSVLILFSRSFLFARLFGIEFRLVHLTESERTNEVNVHTWDCMAKKVRKKKTVFTSALL